MLGWGMFMLCFTNSIPICMMNFETSKAHASHCRDHTQQTRRADTAKQIIIGDFLNRNLSGMLRRVFRTKICAHGPIGSKVGRKDEAQIDLRCRSRVFLFR